MARSIILPGNAFRSFRTRCAKCGEDIPVTGVRFTLRAITVEAQCEPCRTVHAREYNLTSVGNFTKEVEVAK